MEKLIVFTVMVALSGACGGKAPAENRTGRTNSSPPAATVSNVAASPSPGATLTAGPGERIEKDREVSFAPGGFPEDWRWTDSERETNPSKFELKPGGLKIDIPTGKDLYGETRTAPLLLKSVTGDFEIETKLKFDPKESYQGAGLLIFRNDSNYLRLERAFGGVGGGDSGIRFDSREDEAYEPIATPVTFVTTSTIVELKFRRIGKEFTGFWREPGGQWKTVGKFTGSYPETLQAGIIACNTAAPIGVEFEYVKLGPVKQD